MENEQSKCSKSFSFDRSVSVSGYSQLPSVECVCVFSNLGEVLKGLAQ